MFIKEKLKLTRLQINKILPNPSQPRKVFADEDIKSLGSSIEENGLLQPITVRREGSLYYLIAGERRLRACKLIGMRDITAIITDCQQSESAVLAILENIQRKDLNMFEQANSMVNLLREWEITQDEAAKKLGMSQSYLANKVRLLKLTKDEQDDIITNNLTERHARALLKINDVLLRKRLLQVILEKKLNVAQTEELIQIAERPKETVKKQKRTFIAKDIRLFINTIDHAVDAMKTAGIHAESEKIETDEYIECTVRIPKLKRVQV